MVGTHFPGTSQSADTAKWTQECTSQTYAPELEMQQMLQLDLLLRPANLTSPVPTWHGAPSQVNHTMIRVQQLVLFVLASIG